MNHKPSRSITTKHTKITSLVRAADTIIFSVRSYFQYNNIFCRKIAMACSPRYCSKFLVSIILDKTNKKKEGKISLTTDESVSTNCPKIMIITHKILNTILL